jgi:hypothetical protein
MLQAAQTGKQFGFEATMRSERASQPHPFILDHPMSALPRSV